jgi:cysteine desulfurase/selenocysteine lyase
MPDTLVSKQNLGVSPRSENDPRRIRAEFPFLERIVRGNSIVYFDNAATTQKPRQVIQTLQTFYERFNSNIGRSTHTPGLEAEELYRQARRNVARFIGADAPEEILFLRGCTEAINLLAYSMLCSTKSRFHLEAGDEIVLTVMEHHSNLLPWRMLRDLRGIELKVADLREDGSLDMDALEFLVSKRTKLVCCTHASNVLGTINPIEEIGHLAHSVGALMLVDAAQSVPHLPVDIKTLGCDFMAFSGHKMLAPLGTGVLYGRKDLLDELSPFKYGGGMVRDIVSDEFAWDEPPGKFEAGTPDVAGAVALGGAVSPDGGKRLEGAVGYLEELGRNWVRAHEIALTEHALQGLEQIPGIRIYGPLQAQNRGGLIAFNLERTGKLIDDHLVAQLLDQAGIAVRAGGHCAHPLIRRLGVQGAVRVSFYIYNTVAEVDFFLETLKDIVTRQIL